MPDISVVIFDMYETLVENTGSLWLQTFDEICQEQGLPLTGQELWNLWKPVEMGFRRNRLDLAYPESSPPFKSYEKAWLECFQEVFKQMGSGDAAAAARSSVSDLGRRKLFPETVSVIARLKGSRRFRLAVMSNSDNDSLRPLLRRHGLEFDAVVCSEAAQVYKPHPQAFRIIMEALGVEPNICLYVGDSQYDDVQGAHDVGMKTVWINRRGNELDPALPLPDYQVVNLTELLGILGVSK